MRVEDLSASDRRDYDNLPTLLRELLDAELAVGNEIAAVQHDYPAAPIGASFILAGPVRSRPRQTVGELRFFGRNSSLYSGEFTVAPLHFFILEPPLPERPYPDMDALRLGPPPPPPPGKNTPLSRFAASMVIDSEKWYDGVGYDLSQIPLITSDQRKDLEAELIIKLRDNGDRRDVEALIELDSPTALAAAAKAAKHHAPDVRNYAERHVAVDLSEREAQAISAIERAAAMSGIGHAVELAEECNTPDVRRAVLNQARTGNDSTTRVHMAALLYFLCGKSKESFDWDHRPYFLRFGESDTTVDFRAAWHELRDVLKHFEAARR